AAPLLPACNPGPPLRRGLGPPPQQLDEGSVGLRLAGVYADADWSLYYYNGAETAPAFNQVTRAHARNPFTTPPPQSAVRLQADVDLEPRFGRIWLAGGDVALPLGGFTVRVEGAYGGDRLLARPARSLLGDLHLSSTRAVDLFTKLANGKTVTVPLPSLFEERDTIEWGAGVDYRFHGWMPVLQLNQTVVLHNSVELLVNDVDTRIFLVVRKA